MVSARKQERWGRRGKQGYVPEREVVSFKTQPSADLDEGPAEVSEDKVSVLSKVVKKAKKSLSKKTKSVEGEG